MGLGRGNGGGGAKVGEGYGKDGGRGRRGGLESMGIGWRLKLGVGTQIGT